MVKIELIKSFSPDLILELTQIYQRIFPHKKITSKLIADSLVDKKSHFVIARDQNQIVGFLYGWLVEDEFQVLDIGVLESFRKRGIGSHLLHYLFDMILQNSAGTVTLEVSSKNRIAIDFYERHGFKQVGQRPDYYPDRSDAILMDWTKSS